MHIRPATAADLPTIVAIYNDVLLHSTAIYRDLPVTLEERAEWIASQGAKGYPVLVAVSDDEPEVVLGFASFGDFRSGSGYRFTVEGSIHLRPEARHRGTGTALLQAQIGHAQGKHMLMAGVDSGNEASLRFLEKHGFERCALVREAGYKFGRFLDLVLLQHRL